MGRHSTWNETDHPRAFDGKFAHAVTGGAPRDGGDKPRRGMPDAITTSDIPVRGGKELALDYHRDGTVTISSGKATVRLSESNFSQLGRLLDRFDAEDTEPGREETLTDIQVRGGSAHSTLNALVRKDEDGTVSLHLAPSDDPSYEDMQNAPALRLNSKDIAAFHNANTRAEAATRVDTGNGDVDLFIGDDDKFTLRHLDDDGRPKEVKFTPKDFAKLSHAIDAVIDGWDEEDDSLADDEVVTKRTVRTSAGTINVEIHGPYDGRNPGDRLEITAQDGSWGIVLDGSTERDFAEAISKVEVAGENLEIYNASMK
ncbi:hypothetical protein Sme01_03010 [Sphaerisporangium melleum]|uniref:Uncharacterized protein n=1 Tax=Sphaerisporangium melleum TaxID=321316 RepID=A0A917VCI6_9ACTN|nr:hypothetical protein [Sphaerisporangium melleum]GGK61321.1 hypothetical protein GCM10007964_00550 [Sphaerisporangium melleum]GII67825.1 hypothetical protein Sme01_03010 [Sphaerisporangium melleum]